MADQVTRLAERLRGIDFSGGFAHERSRGYLMKEYLRRAAWWAQATRSQEWPFFDIAATVNPAIRADSSLVERALADLQAKRQGVPVQRACVRALHFAALLDSGADLPAAPMQPFEPLVVMFERGGGFRVESGGLIEVDTLGIRTGTLEENLSPDPVVALDKASLDALD